MSRIYRMVEHDRAEVIKKLIDQEIPGLVYVHKPVGDDGKVSLWPHAVTNGADYGWFEDDMILFWGLNDESKILGALKQAGIRTRYVG